MKSGSDEVTSPLRWIRALNFGALLPLAPAGRHVYSGIREDYLTQGREGAEDAGKSGIESVGVGSPNPSGEETKPLR